MNGAHTHLILNHIPVLGTFFGLALLILALARKSEELTRVALATFAFVAVMAIATYLSGQQAEEAVEHLAGFPEDAIEEHEESALFSLIAIESLGLASLVGLLFFRRSRRIPRQFAVVCVAAAILAGTMLAWTAHLGRQIRHSEIQSTPPTPALVGIEEWPAPFFLHKDNGDSLGKL